MKSKTLHLIILIFSAVYTISCHDDDPAPLRFYDNYYEVPMGGKRHLGIESGNGNYSVEIADTRIATAGVEYGWTENPKRLHHLCRRFSHGKHSAKGYRLCHYGKL